jgi:class 3 adenylate cyclase
MSLAPRHATASRPHRPRVAPRACVTTAGRSSAVRYSVAAPAWPAVAAVPDGAARSATRGVDAGRTPGHERRSVTVMFTDIEDSSALVERLGDHGWLELYRRHSALVHRHVARHRGVVVKGQGDGFMAAFADPAAAVDCAVALQHALAAAPAGEERVRVRIGLHTGAAIRQAGDYHGRTVVIAARIAGQARGGEILVSADVADAVHRAGGATLAARGDVTLKGLDGRHAVYAA